MIESAEHDKELLRVLQQSLSRPIARIAHQPSDYASSFELKELNVVFEDGTGLELIFKNIGPAAILPAARDAKQQLHFDPRREIEMYRRFLSPADHGTAICHGSVNDEADSRYWLFLQRIKGLKLSFTGDFEIWLEAVRWLARFHSDSSLHAEAVRQQLPVITHDPAYYRRWCERAVDFVARTTPQASDEMRRVSNSHERIIKRLMHIPACICHGDCYPSNLLVRGLDSAHPICPVDWELTAIGPGLMDLAALTAGKWSERQKEVFAATYWASLSQQLQLHWSSAAKLNDDLVWCRLQLAVQWLGYSPRWAPPIDQANSWLNEMITLSQTLGLL